jgi:hypothetical protein
MKPAGFARATLLAGAAALTASACGPVQVRPPDPAVHVFLLAGQSNMVGADARAERIDTFPPFLGAGGPQESVLYRYSVGNIESVGWEALRPVRGGEFGPELTFARKIKPALRGRIAIVKCAVGGTTLAVQWDPDTGPLYAKAIGLTRSALADLRAHGLKVSLDGVLWHQGENDMLSAPFRERYEERLVRFIARVREDLGEPGLKFYIGEISDKGIWGLDNRANMTALREQQLRVVARVPGTRWVPTRHLSFEVMGSGQPHFHFGTLGQLQMGEAFADAVLSDAVPASVPRPAAPKAKINVPKGEVLKIFILAGQRDMEGEESFLAELAGRPESRSLLAPRPGMLFRYSLGGGARVAAGWGALAPVPEYLGYFGPELSFGAALADAGRGPTAILKITDGCGVMLDWDAGLEGYRGLYRKSLAFIRASCADLEKAGIAYRFEGVFWLQGEYDAYFKKYRPEYRRRLGALIASLRRDLSAPGLVWRICELSPRSPWGAEAVAFLNGEIRALAAADPAVRVVSTADLPHARRIHFGTEGTLALGRRMAEAYLEDGGR